MGMRDENMPRLRYRELHGTDFRQVLFGWDYDRFDWERTTGLDYPYDLALLISVACHETNPGEARSFFPCPNAVPNIPLCLKLSKARQPQIFIPDRKTF